MQYNRKNTLILLDHNVFSFSISSRENLRVLNFIHICLLLLF